MEKSTQGIFSFFHNNNINTAILLLAALFVCCDQTGNQSFADKKETESFAKGSFAYDLDFLRKYLPGLVTLQNEDSSRIVAISTAYQGRVMTSTASGKSGSSFGWINYDLISSGKKEEHINVYGGEDRFWLGPEGGQFSFYFKPDVPFDFDNWFVPAVIDTEPFELVSKTNTKAHFSKSFQLTNYSGNEFQMKVDRHIELSALPSDLPKGVNAISFRSENSLTNTGASAWNKKTGMPSIWILGMFLPTDQTTIVIPYKEGDDLGKIVTDDYFGKIPDDRLKVIPGFIFFRGDGKHRGKLGLSPQRAKAYCGSYDSGNKVLTIIHYSLVESNTDYVNSTWQLQDAPFAGDVINSYNDGPLEDGSQLGPFYELESSSPAAALAPHEKMTHIHTTMHFQGEEKDLDLIAQKFLGIGIAMVKQAFE